MFGAKALGLSEAKTATLKFYCTFLGFTEDKTAVRFLVAAQGYPSIRVRADLAGAVPSIVAVTGLSMKGVTSAAFWGLLSEEPVTLLLTAEDLKTTIISIYTGYKSGKPESVPAMLPNAQVLEGDVTVTVKTLRLNKGDTYDFGAEVDCFAGFMNDTAFKVDGEPTKISFPFAAENIVTLPATAHEIVIYQVITGTPEEIEADIPLVKAREKQDMEEMLAGLDDEDDLSDPAADLAA